MSLTIGSLFSGIGGLELGLEWAGLGPVVWQVERDAWCRAQLAALWPRADRTVHDVEDARVCALPHVDVLCGGFPCTNISWAGDGRGLDGDDSRLWYAYARIIGVVRPRYVVVENVAALLDRGMGDVLGSLAALGYDAVWDCLPARSVGAPHLRDRLFLVAYTDRPGREARDADADGDGSPRGLRRSAREAPPADRRGNAAVRRPADDALGAHPDAHSAGRRQLHAAVLAALPRFDPGRVAARGRAHWHTTEPGVGALVHGVPPDAVRRIRALGNAVVPFVAEVVGHWIVAHARLAAARESAQIPRIP